MASVYQTIVATTVAGVWTLAIPNPTPGRTSTLIKPHEDNTIDVYVAVVGAGKPAPTSSPWVAGGSQDDVLYRSVVGDVYNELKAIGGAGNDFYIAAVDGSAGQKITLWEVVG